MSQDPSAFALMKSQHPEVTNHTSCVSLQSLFHIYISAAISTQSDNIYLIKQEISKRNYE